MSDATIEPGAEPARIPEPAVTHQPGGAAGADMTQAVTRIERGVKDRRSSDTTLINYWLYFFLVSYVTFGIYAIILFFKRIVRVDAFSARKKAYYDGLIVWTRRYAEQNGKDDRVHHMLEDVRAEVDAAYKGKLRPVKAGLSLLLTIVTFGLYGFVVQYRLNRYWWDAQVLEQDVNDAISRAWVELGLMRYPITFTLDQGKNRSFALYLVLSFITLGAWGIVWDYKIHTDPEALYPEFHSVEDTVLHTIRSH